MLRITNQSKPELEWLYLVNETLEGEKIIVPLLRDILKDPKLPLVMRSSIEQQLDEEIEHVRLFYNLVGRETLIGSDYGSRFYKYVIALNSLTLKLFALQGMLEGIALGAIQYRLQNWSTFDAFRTDKIVYLDELNHVECSFGHFLSLSKQDGIQDMSQFRAVARDVNKIFSDSFNGIEISRIFFINFSVTLDPVEIENSIALKKFRKMSSKIIIENRRKFLNQYFTEVSL